MKRSYHELKSIVVVSQQNSNIIIYVNPREEWNFLFFSASLFRRKLNSSKSSSLIKFHSHPSNYKGKLLLSSLNLLSPRNMFVSSGIHLSSILNIQLFNLTHLFIFESISVLGFAITIPLKIAFFKDLLPINILCVCVKIFSWCAIYHSIFLIVVQSALFFFFFFLADSFSNVQLLNMGVTSIQSLRCSQLYITHPSYFSSIALNFYFQIHLLSFLINILL